MNRDDRLFAIIGGLVVAAVTTFFLVVAGGITGSVDTGPRLTVSPILEEPVPVVPPEVVPASFEAPQAESGDDLVRSLLSTLADHPRWLSWLMTDGLTARFVNAVEAVADGYSPREPLDFLAPGRPFLVREAEDSLVIAAGTYRRFDVVAAVVESIDATAAVALYRRLEPDMERARHDVAWHRGDLEDRLRAAVDHLLAVEVPVGPIEVEQRTRSYVFAADELEHLSDAQRQLLRMGAGNAVRIQNKLREIRDAFGWPDIAEPAATVRHAVITGEGEAPEPPPVIIAEAAAGTFERTPMVEPVTTERAAAEPVASAFDAPLVTSEGLAP